MYNKILQRAKELEIDIVRFLSDLIATPSFSCKEKEVISVIKREMESAGFDNIIIDGLGNIIGSIGSGKRIIAFDAHIDTVYGGDETQWDSNPFEPNIKNGKIFGRGSADQKAGMASMVYAGKIIKELGINKDFTILFTGTVMEEDCDGLCWQYIINEGKIKPELVIITEPTNMNIYRGHRGRMEMTVSVNGISCHGSAPERGDNAIYKISKIALETEKLNERLISDDFLGKGTITVTKAESSSPSLCAVPDFAKIYIDRRLTYGETKESAVKEVRDVCQSSGYKDAVVEVLKYSEKSYTGIEYPAEKYFPTWKLDENSPYLKKASDVYEKLFNKKPLIDKWTFSTNGVAIAGMYNIPCFGLGPGNEIYAHAPNENCEINQLGDAAAFYAGLIYEMNI